MDTLLNFNEAAERLSCSPYSLRAWAKRGLIHTVKLGRRRLIPSSECERIIRDGLRTERIAKPEAPLHGRPAMTEFDDLIELDPQEEQGRGGLVDKYERPIETEPDGQVDVSV